MSNTLSALSRLWTSYCQEIKSAPSDNKVGIKMFMARVIGIDRAVAWINLSNVWSLVRAPFSLFFIVTYLSVEQQGLWYTFSNLAALSVFAELGFTMIISQFISHEYSRLNLTNGQLVGDEYYLDRLISLATYAIKFYFIVVLLAIIILSIVGFFYFHDQPHSVFGAWAFFSLTSGLGLFIGLLLAIYRGLDKVAETQKAVLASAVVGTIFTLFALYCGLNIWAIPIGSGVGALVMICLIIRLAPRFWVQLYRYRPSQRFSWAREIIWLQGKYAISFASAYFTFNLLVPAVFKIEGAVAAGQLGLSMAIVAAMQGVAGASVVANVPKLNMLIADGKRKESYQLVFRTTITSSALYICGAILLIVALMALKSHGFYEERFLSLPLFILVLTYQLASTVASSASAFLRAHKEEPHLPVSIVCGGLIAIAIFTVLPHYGLFWLLVIFNLTFWLIAVPWIFWLVIQYKKRYDHAPV